MPKRPPVPIRLTLERDGKAYQGNYTMKRGTVYVEYSGHRQAAQVGNSPPRTIARMVLSDLVTKSQLH